MLPVSLMLTQTRFGRLADDACYEEMRAVLIKQAERAKDTLMPLALSPSRWQGHWRKTIVPYNPLNPHASKP
jgi:hypothetical protein